MMVRTELVMIYGVVLRKKVKMSMPSAMFSKLSKATLYKILLVRHNHQITSPASIVVFITMIAVHCPWFSWDIQTRYYRCSNGEETHLIPYTTSKAHKHNLYYGTHGMLNTYNCVECITMFIKTQTYQVHEMNSFSSDT